MFRQAVSRTALTSEIANDMFSHIRGSSYKTDVSFISTLRALVAPRMQEGEQINLYFTESNYSDEDIKNRSIKNAMGLLPAFNNADPGSIIIHEFNNGNECCDYAWLELIKSSFTKYHPDWHRLDKITDFFRKSFYVLCFVNPEIKSVVIFVDTLKMQKIHYLQCSIFAFLPWYFDPKQGVSSLEMELIETLRKKDSSEYCLCIEKIAAQYDFRAEKIKRLLSGFESNYERVQTELIRRDIADYIREIDRISGVIGDLLKSKNQKEIELLGLETKISKESEESEVMEYFLHNDKLMLVSVNNTRLTFTVKTYLEYFDEDFASRILENKSSYFYKPDGRSHENIITAENIEKLMRAVFVDQSLRMKVCATYQLDMHGTVSPLRRHPYDYECDEFAPNPHIDEYSCIGNYHRSIVEFLKRHDYIGAIEQCSASCKSLNFGDSTVMSEFMRRIYGISGYADRQYINKRFIELPDGTMATPIEAIEWINAQEVEADE